MMTVKNFDQKGASLFGLPVSDKSGGLNLLGKGNGSIGNIGLGNGSGIAQPGIIAPSRDRRDVEDGAESRGAGIDDVYVFNPDNHPGYYSNYHEDEDLDGGTDTLRLTGVGADEVRIKRAWEDQVFIEANDNSFSLLVQVGGANAIERVHFDEDGNGIEDDGPLNIRTNDELLRAITENVAIYVDDDRSSNTFFYYVGDGHQFISDEDNNNSDTLIIMGISDPDDVILTRNNDDLVWDYNAPNADDLVRTYNDLQLEFPDGQTILLKYVLEGSDRGVDRIYFDPNGKGHYEDVWTKADIIAMARALEDPQSSEDQFFHGFGQDDDTYIYSRGDGHDTILEGDNKGNDVLRLSGGILSSDVTVSYSKASNSYINASDYGVGDIANPDLLIELGGRGDAATGSVLLALGAVDGYGVESIHFDENGNGIEDAGEILWGRADMLAAAEATAAADVDDVYVFSPGDYSSYYYDNYNDQDQDYGTDTLRLTDIGELEVLVRRSYRTSSDADGVCIEANDNSFTVNVQLGGIRGFERVHFDENGNGIEDGDDSILTKDELLTAITENMAIYVNHPTRTIDEFFYDAGDGHQIIGDQDNGTHDYLHITGFSADDVILTRNNDAPVMDYNAPNADDLVRTYDDLQLEFRDGKTILLKYVLDGSNRGVDQVLLDPDGDGHNEATWTQADMIEMARALEDPQSSEDQFFHGFSFAEDNSYIYSQGDGHDAILEGDDAGNDILALRGGISSSDVTVSYSNASNSYIDASNYGAGDIAYPDLLLEFGGRGDAATGSVLLALGAVDGFGIESVLFDSNNNGIADAGEISWSKAEMVAAAEADLNDVYVFDPGDYSRYHFGYHYDEDLDGGTDTLRLTGVGAHGEHEVRVRRGHHDSVFIEAYDNSFTLEVQVGGTDDIDRVHFDENGNGIEDGDDSILTNDELLTMVATNAIEDMAIYVDHGRVGRVGDEFFYNAGDGHQFISDEDNNASDILRIYGWTADDVILTRNNDALVGDYTPPNGEDLVRTYDDLQLEFTDGQTILLKHVLEGGDRGVDQIWFDTDGDGHYEAIWTKADIIEMARDLVIQSSEDQFFHGFSFAEDNSYTYSRGDGHDAILEDRDAGNDVLVLKGGISSSDITVSRSNASNSYINASDYGVGDIANPDLLLEFGGRGAATGSVLLALGAVDGFGIESVLFDENGNGIADAGEVLWDKGDILAAADADVANDTYVFNPGDYSSYHYGLHSDLAGNGGTDTLRVTGVGEREVYVRRADGGQVFIEANDNSFTLKVQVSGANGIERFHFDDNGNGIEDDGDDSILTNDELLTAITEDMAIYVDHPDVYRDYFYYSAGDSHQFIVDQDNHAGDYLAIHGLSADDVILTRNADDPVRNYNARNGEDLVRTYDDLQLEFTDGQTILLKYVLEGGNRGVDKIWFDTDDDGVYDTSWTKADMIAMARDLVTQSSKDQFFHGFSFAEDNSYIYSQGDGHDTIFDGYNKGNDVLRLRGISSSDAAVSYSNAGRSYINASDYGAGDIAHPDLLLEFGGRGDEANGSVLLALGAVDGFGIESVLFDENDNGIADAGEISWSKAEMVAAAEADLNDVYVFAPAAHSGYHSGNYEDGDHTGIDTLRLTGVGSDEVRVRRHWHNSHVYIEAYDNRFTLEVRVSGAKDIERVHFDEDGNGIEDDGDHNILTKDELLTAITEDIAIYVNHPGSSSDLFYYHAGDGHQIIGDQDNGTVDYLGIHGFFSGDVIWTRNDDAPVRDYNARNGEDLVRTYDDLQLEFTDGKTILLKDVLEGRNRGVDTIWFDGDDDGVYEDIWDKGDMIRMARSLVTQSSDDQFFHGFSFAQHDAYEYSLGDGHDTIFEGYHAGDDVLVLKGGISSSDATVSYSNAGRSYIDASDYGAGDIANPDLLIEFGGRGDEATGSVLLALGAVDGYGIESILFDTNDNGIADAGEILWDRDEMLAAADATAEIDDVHVFDPDDHSSYHWGYHYDQDQDHGTDTLRLTGVGEHEVYVRRGPYIGGDFVFIEANDNSFSLLVPLDGSSGMDRFHFDENGNGDEDDGDDSILTNSELLAMAATEDRAIYVDSPDNVSRNEFFYGAGDGYLIISDEDNDTSDYLVIRGWGPDQVTLTRNDDLPVRDYNTPNGEDLVRTYDDLQLEFPDGKTILLKYVLEGSDRGVDRINFDVDNDGVYESSSTWTKADMIAMASDLVAPQSSENQFFHGLPQDDFYIYSRGDGYDTIFEGYRAGDDILALRGGISSNDFIVSYSNASRPYINASNYGVGHTAFTDLLLEFGGRGDVAPGSVLLALGAVDGFGIESVLFDENGNGIKDGNEISWDKDDMLAAADATVLANDDYYFNPDNYSGYHFGYYYDFDQDGGSNALIMAGVGEHEVRVRRGGGGSNLYIDANDNSFTLYVAVGGSEGIDRVHFAENGAYGPHNILTSDELLMAITENMVINVNHPDSGFRDPFYYHAGDGHQIIGDQDDDVADVLYISGFSADEVILTRNNDLPVRDYNTGNAEDPVPVRTYDDLQLEFTDGKTILLKDVLEGSDRGVDIIEFDADGDGHYEAIWTKADIIAMARDLEGPQSSEDQFFHGFSFAEDNSYEYSLGDGHDTIFEDRDAGNDVLVLKGGISSSDIAVSYSNAGRSYINISDYGASDIVNPDLLIEFEGRGAAANGSVLLVLGAVDGYGIESVLFDENGNGIADDGEISWSKDDMLAAADADADDVYVFNPGRYSGYHFGYYDDLGRDYGTDILRLTGIGGADEVRVRRGYYGSNYDSVFIEDYDNSFTLEVAVGGADGIERFHFDKNGNGVKDGDDSILTKDELLTAITENMAIYVDHAHGGRIGDEFYYIAGDGHQIISDEDNNNSDFLFIKGWSSDDITLTRNADDPVRGYNTGNADGPVLVRTYDDLQLEFRDGKTILLKHVLDGSNMGVDTIQFDADDDGGTNTSWTKADMIAMARALVIQSSEDQFFHGFAEDDFYVYSRGDGHDTILEGDNKGNDVLRLSGGILSSDVTVSYSDASDSYINASDYGVGDIAYPDLLIELGGRGDAATGSVLLALGAVDGYGVESVLFDENSNGIADAGEILWDRDEMLAAADATAAADLFG